MPGVVAKRHAPAAARNREPIRDALGDVLPARGLVLEVASGSGEHAVFLARAFPALAWQPTDADPSALASIEAWRAEAALPNLLAPVPLDARELEWNVPPLQAIVCINMIHISPWESCLGLFAGAARNLAERPSETAEDPTRSAPLVLYGPFRFGGRFTAPSNAEFDASLRARDPAWGVRDLDDVTRVATAVGFEREHVIEMPANNHVIVFRRTEAR